MKTLAAGDLRTKLYIQREQYEQDSAGDPIQNPETGERRMEWVTYKTAFGNIAYLSGREFVAAGAMVSEMAARVTVRWFAAFKPSDRFVRVSDGKVFSPKGVLPDLESGREFITVPCSEGANEEA